MGTINRSNKIETIRKSLDILDLMHKNVRGAITELIVDTVGYDTPLTFNDETSFPNFNDDSEGPVAIVGVKVVVGPVGINALYFNDQCSDDYDSGVDEEAWFIPENYGTYDLTELFDVIVNAITKYDL